MSIVLPQRQECPLCGSAALVECLVIDLYRCPECERIWVRRPVYDYTSHHCPGCGSKQVQQQQQYRQMVVIPTSTRDDSVLQWQCTACGEGWIPIQKILRYDVTEFIKDTTTNCLEYL